jgi:hypothetical protein
MNYAQWRNSYTPYFTSLSIILILVLGCTHISLVEFRGCILSVYMQFRYCPVGSLLLHLCGFLFFLSILYSTPFCTMHCAHL